MRYSIVAGRIVAAALLVWMAYIHLHLWDHGYRHIATIGPLFLVNGIAAIVVAIAVLAAPGRLLPIASLGAGGLTAGTLVGLIISCEAGLFGFKDSFSAPYAKESLVVEAVATVVALTLAGVVSHLPKKTN